MFEYVTALSSGTGYANMYRANYLRPAIFAMMDNGFVIVMLVEVRGMQNPLSPSHPQGCIMSYFQQKFLGFSKKK